MGDLMADPLHSHPGTTLNQFPVNTFVLRDNFGSSWSSRDHVAQLLSRALTAPASAARTGRILRRADAGYFAGQLARAALWAQVEFAIDAFRIAPLWRLLEGVSGKGLGRRDRHGVQGFVQ